MKKTIALLMSLLLLVFLASCATVEQSYTLSQDGANVQSIEIYRTEMPYDECNIHLFLTEQEPVAVLQPESYADFLDDLCELRFQKEIVLFPIPMDGGCDYVGYIIAVIYSDGGYDLIAGDGLYSYGVGRDGEGEHRYDYADYGGEIPWTELVEGYIEQYGHPPMV